MALMKNVVVTERDDRMISATEVRVAEGDEVLVSCYSTGFTKWFYEDNKGIPVGARLLEEARDLVIKKVANYHAGQYYCYGSTKTKFFIALTNIIVFCKW